MFYNSKLFIFYLCHDKMAFGFHDLWVRIGWSMGLSEVGAVLYFKAINVYFTQFGN